MTLIIPMQYNYSLIPYEPSVSKSEIQTVCIKRSVMFKGFTSPGFLEPISFDIGFPASIGFRVQR